LHSAEEKRDGLRIFSKFLERRERGPRTLRKYSGQIVKSLSRKIVLW